MPLVIKLNLGAPSTENPRWYFTVDTKGETMQTKLKLTCPHCGTVHRRDRMQHATDSFLHHCERIDKTIQVLIHPPVNSGRNILNRVEWIPLRTPGETAA